MGWYVMGPEKYCKDQNYTELFNKEFGLRGGHYQLILDSTGDKPPQLFKENKEESYSAAMQSLEKICSDSMQLQNSKESSALQKSLSKQEELLLLYNEKAKKVLKLISEDPKNVTNEQKRKLMEALNNYERLKHHSKHKERTI